MHTGRDKMESAIDSSALSKSAKILMRTILKKKMMAGTAGVDSIAGAPPVQV